MRARKSSTKHPFLFNTLGTVYALPERLVAVTCWYMGKAYKNFWSLNTDEAVVAGILRDGLGRKNAEVLLPLNAQMKGIDLVIMGTKSKKVVTVQVKGSRAFEPKRSESEKFGHGSTGWFFLPKNVIDKAQSDYFVFLIYVIEQSLKSGRRFISPHTIAIPTKKLVDLSKKYKTLHPDRYSFYFWVNPKNKQSFDFRDKQYDVSEYLDGNGFEKLAKLVY